MDNDNLEVYEPQSLEEAVKDRIWRQLVYYIDNHTNYTQAELAEILNVYPPDVSNLLNGKNSKFSMSKLIRYAGKLNLKVQCELLTQSVTNVTHNG
jgi:predicted XRE-type DNA-binding protein